MSSVAAQTVAADTITATRPTLDHKPGFGTVLLFLILLLIGVGYTGYSLVNDVNRAMPHGLALLSFFLLGVALLIALGFEFVNGFHDTANAVATVIYTHSLPPPVAVVYSGVLNFLGVLFSSGAVAFGIISLLPVELILQVGSSAGFAMVFALLIAAIIWNLGTWYLGLPASSSHTLIGSIIGVGVANALMHGRDGTSGVDWAQATKISYSLLISPRVGFVGAAVLLPVLKALGLGTMVGWKRIVVTIGEKIGKTHLTYAQGACAEVVAMSTIAAADMFGLPVSTTRVLSSGVAGTMAANRSGLQWVTLRNLVMAWVLTLPAAIVLAGVLYWLFRQVF